MIAQPPIQFDRTSGLLEGANTWERAASLALVAGSKVSSLFAHRGYNWCANLLRKTLPERDIAVRLNPDATFAFPYGDGYWSKLLNRSFTYEEELELLFRASADVDYTLLDCGANYGYWSVLVTSKPFGSRKAIAIEPDVNASLRHQPCIGDTPKGTPLVHEQPLTACRHTIGIDHSHAGTPQDVMRKARGGSFRPRCPSVKTRR